MPEMELFVREVGVALVQGVIGGAFVGAIAGALLGLFVGVGLRAARVLRGRLGGGCVGAIAVMMVMAGTGIIGASSGGVGGGWVLVSDVFDRRAAEIDTLSFVTADGVAAAAHLGGGDVDLAGFRAGTAPLAAQAVSRGVPAFIRRFAQRTDVARLFSEEMLPELEGVFPPDDRPMLAGALGALLLLSDERVIAVSDLMPAGVDAADRPTLAAHLRAAILDRAVVGQARTTAALVVVVGGLGGAVIALLPVLLSLFSGRGDGPATGGDTPASIAG